MKWLEQSNIFANAWFSSAQTFSITKFLVNFRDKTRRAHTVWPNDWVFVHELSGSGFESSCSYLGVKYIWKQNLKSFSNETLNSFFIKFCFSYILDLAKTVWALHIFSQKFTRNFVIKELWILENHIRQNMYFWIWKIWTTWRIIFKI